MRPILVLATNTAAYPNGTPTGLWLSEFTHFYDEVVADIPVIVASPSGGNVPFDPVSLRAAFMDRSTREHYGNNRTRTMLANTEKIADMNPDDFSAIYFTGGHGTMFDFVGNPAVEDFTVTLHKSGGLVSGVCHGVGALTTLRDENGYLIAGKRVTGFSNREEKLAMRTNHVPFLLEDALKATGAHYSKTLLPFTSYVVEDGQFITGQNPQSPRAVGHAVHAALMKNLTPGSAAKARQK